jgi:hypothetical protein
MPRDFQVEELLSQRTSAYAAARRFIGRDPTAGLAPNSHDWCSAIERDRPRARDIGFTYRSRTRWTPDGDDMLGWATLLMTAPAILIGALLAVVSLGL